MKGAGTSPTDTSRTIVVVQARTGSTRFPAKVIADLGGIPMLAFQLRRLRPLPWPVVVATSDLGRDDVVEGIATAEGAATVRGPEADVLARFEMVLDRHPDADIVVRLTADCPLTDPAIVRAVVERLVETGADYASNVHPRSFPKGLDVEACTSDALRAAARDATDPYDREHVTPFLYRNPDRFSTANVQSGLDAGGVWWTVDTPADLRVVESMIVSAAHQGMDPITMSHIDYVALTYESRVPT